MRKKRTELKELIYMQRLADIFAFRLIEKDALDDADAEAQNVAVANVLGVLNQRITKSQHQIRREHKLG
jgi:hypothetical protein